VDGGGGFEESDGVVFAEEKMVVFASQALFSQDILQCSQTTACIPEKLGSNPGHHLPSF